MVIVRSDGSPVYLLSAICDDYQMGITDAIDKFNIKKISKSVSRFDTCILNKINKNIIKNKLPEQIINYIKEISEYEFDLDKFKKGFGELTQRSNTLLEIIDIYNKYFTEPNFDLQIPILNQDLILKLKKLYLIL